MLRALCLALLALLVGCRVRGVVTHGDAPVQGLIVVAESGSTLVGYAVTDAQGRYEIDVGNVSSVNVVAMSSRYTFAQESRPVSFGFRDQEAEANFVALQETPFTPSIHGFHFRNSWEITQSNSRAMQFPGDDSVAILPYKEFAMAINPVGSTMGLCGGMATLARDFYVAGLPVPSREAAPYPSLSDAASNELYEAIWYRLLDTWGGDDVLPVYDQVLQDLPTGSLIPDHYSPENTDLEKMIFWMVDYPLDGPGGLYERTRSELDTVMQQLDRGEMLDLYLLLRHDPGNWDFDYVSTQVGNNHQVLVYDYEADASSLSLRVYDPNFPGDDAQRIDVALDGGGNITSISGSYSIYGIFVGKHVLAPKVPSAALIEALVQK